MRLAVAGIACQYRSASDFGASGQSVAYWPFNVVPPCENIVATFMNCIGKLSVGLDSRSSEEVVGRELHIERGQILVELLQPSRADDGGRHARPSLHPGQRNARPDWCLSSFAMRAVRR